MKKQLSLRARPKTLDELVGQQGNVKRIRRLMKDTVPKGFLFCGPRGSGKTSIARIIALSLQCKHQKKFGQPCLKCRRYKRAGVLPIHEINCGKLRSVEELEKIIELANHEVTGRGIRKVFILDEAHRLSGHAQDLLLVPIEDEDSDVVWIICSTKPGNIVDTVRSRCRVFNMKPFAREDVETLVEDLMTRLGSALSRVSLVEALLENDITSARLIAHAVESYVAGDTPEEAASVDSSSEVDSRALCAAVVKADWEDVVAIMRKAKGSDVRDLRRHVINFLKNILLDCKEQDDRATAVSKAIKRLAYIGSAEEANQWAALVAELYTVATIMGKYAF